MVASWKRDTCGDMGSVGELLRIVLLEHPGHSLMVSSYVVNLYPVRTVHKRVKEDIYQKSGRVWISHSSVQSTRRRRGAVFSLVMNGY